jgi:hypothetical protein
MNAPHVIDSVTADHALAVAWRDANRVYRDLTNYRASVSLEADGWHVDFELKSPTSLGGGPHYVIDSATGSIRSRVYEQ